MADNRFKVMAVGNFKESAVDCPVQLKKYQIIYDVVADKMYLRVVLENFSSQKIVGVFLNVDCLDIFDNKFAEVTKAALKVECDKKFSEFGKECPFAIPTGTKSVKAYVVKVIFSNMTVWENKDLTFVASVSDLKPYTEIKEREQLEKELKKRRYGARYFPVRYEKCWRCTCGHLNGNDSDTCSACKSRASVLFNIFDDKNLAICKLEDVYNEAQMCEASKDYLKASKLYSTILDYKDSKALFVKALENSKEAIYQYALKKVRTAKTEEDFDDAIKSLTPIAEYKDVKAKIEWAEEKKCAFIYNRALDRVKNTDNAKNFDLSLSELRAIESYKDSKVMIKTIEERKQKFVNKEKRARKIKICRTISIVAVIIIVTTLAMLTPYLIEPNLYTKEFIYSKITIDDVDGYSLEKYNGKSQNIDIPSKYLGKPVLEIGNNAFENKKLKEIIIPDSVRRIGDFAFSGCCLTSMTIPISVISIGESALGYIPRIILPNSLISLGRNAISSSKVGCAFIFFFGTLEEWKNIMIYAGNAISSSRLYYYSEEKPTTTDNYWHFGEDGVTPVIWE